MKYIRLEDLAVKPVSHNQKINKKVIIEPGELPNLVYFSQATFPPGEIADGHAHSDMYEVFFVSEGRGTIRIGDRAYPLAPGTCIAVEPGEIHELINDSQENLVVTYFGIRG
ncbi:cupin domain-containing protein [Oxynema aestuarii]|jgi:quercetin dioxygenase-like cupin family protein|uniref:Cupin domain-containing protein n=1 Tax=Oxynema aestuarii AP17 TaxID=2064643 RepID=A0A6H1U6K3_9CYAN|nr:cupin domain-containing protein [Oxynema aestuarii]QIZ73259.1 cupin domain-containing protein [Oxynema aestuarii AP17]RMH76121.1 MAG: cupin domain-containing protein [Cyanobacteria bacterium J007]